MTPPTPSTPIVCLHSSAASGRQWRRLVADAGAEPDLAGLRWLTPDLYSHGGRSDWPAGQPHRLDVEADGVLAGLALGADEALHLVGHSYGAAVALQLALQHPRRVKSLTLYEPVAFGLLPALGEELPEWLEAQQVAGDVVAALDRGDTLQAARGFVGYWQARDIWPDIDDAQRARLAEPMPAVRRHFDALFAARWTDAQLATLQMPVSLVCGGATRATARRVALTLVQRLRHSRLTMLDDAPHLAPISDPARVNPLLLEGLRRGLAG